MTYLAVVEVNISGRVAKYKAFDDDAEAAAHVDLHGGFVFHNVENWPVAHMRVNGLSVSLEAPEPTNGQINAERDRRIEAGAEFTLSDGTFIPMTGRQPDKDVLLARRIVAAEMLAAGVTDPVLVFRDRDNVNHMLTPAQMVELVDLGLAWFEAMMVRSWHIKDGAGDYTGGRPTDFDQDSHWPTPAELAS